MKRSCTVGLARALVLGWLTAASQLAFGQQGASLAGKVLDENGGTVAGGTVLFYRLSDSVVDGQGRLRSAPLLSGRVTTGGEGGFVIDGLPSGPYYVCAAGVLPNYLRSCQWGGASPRYSVGPGQRVSGIVLAVRSGALLTFDIDDPNSRLATGKKLFVGVISGVGHYYRAEFLSRSGSTSAYRLAVPRNTTLFVIVSTELEVTDSTGAVLPSGVPSKSVTVGAESEIQVRLSVR